MHDREGCMTNFPNMCFIMELLNMAEMGVWLCRCDRIAHGGDCYLAGVLLLQVSSL